MLHVVIMAGGSGTRFWPESRLRRPKQLLPITGHRSMLAETVDRVQPLVPLERIWVITHHSQADGVRAACPELDPQQILAEPMARNTAACVGLAATMVQAVDPKATLAVLPADHFIQPAADFQLSLQAGAAVADQEGSLVTFGIPPHYPATGYGYIRQGPELGSHNELAYFEVDAFVEKPDAPRASEFVAQGYYLWNAGIFVWRADTILQEFQKHMPELAAGLNQIAELTDQPAALQAKIAELYPSFEAVPIDVGILEKADQVRVLRANYQWSDLGSWKALYDELPHDDQANVAVLPSGGELLAEDARGILAYSSQPKTIAVLGMQDIVVVHTDDAILVAPRERSEEVKKLVDRLKAEGKEELL
jgi:mannose-1-phosphate guanylyltransferase